MKKRNLRIQGRMQIFRKMSQKALNRVLTVPDYSTRRELSGTTLKISTPPAHAAHPGVVWMDKER